MGWDIGYRMYYVRVIKNCIRVKWETIKFIRFMFPGGTPEEIGPYEESDAEFLRSYTESLDDFYKQFRKLKPHFKWFLHSKNFNISVLKRYFFCIFSRMWRKKDLSICLGLLGKQIFFICALIGPTNLLLEFSNSECSQ